MERNECNNCGAPVTATATKCSYCYKLLRVLSWTERQAAVETAKDEARWAAEAAAENLKSPEQREAELDAYIRGQERIAELDREHATRRPPVNVDHVFYVGLAAAMGAAVWFLCDIPGNFLLHFG